MKTVVTESRGQEKMFLINGAGDIWYSWTYPYPQLVQKSISVNCRYER